MRTLACLTTILIMGCANPAKNKHQIKTIPNPLPSKQVLTKNGIDSVLKQLNPVKFKAIDKAYREYSDPDGKFRKQLNNMTYYIIKLPDLNKRIVGKFCIKDFIAPDKYYRQSLLALGGEQTMYWLVDKKMLYMFLELIQQLDKLGYDKYAYSIRNSHRHPMWNKEKWKGAKFSQHIYGRAVDLRVGDVNKDGVADQKDKKIMIDILEKIVGNKGGLGLYPHSMCLHFDSRGFRARWNHQ